MYYLQSRYYDPAICRFINADDISYLSANGDYASYNLFAYCSNNPILRKDAGGEFWHVLIGAAVGAAVSFTCSVMSDAFSGESIDWGAALISAGFGAIGGALSATGLGPAVQIIGGAVISGAEDFAQQAYANGGDLTEIDYSSVITSAIEGGISSRSNGLSKATARHVKKLETQSKKRIIGALKHNWSSGLGGIKMTAKEISNAAKYYFKNTNTLVYAPMLNDAREAIKNQMYSSIKGVLENSVSLAGSMLNTPARRLA